MALTTDIPFLDIVDLYGDAVFIADARTGMLLYGNRKACDLTGRTPEEIVSMHHSELHPQEEKDRYRTRFKRCTNRRSCISRGDRSLVTRDGTRVAVEISATTLEVNGRKIVQGIFRERSGRKTIDTKIRDVLARLENLVSEYETSELEKKRLPAEPPRKPVQRERKKEELSRLLRNIFHIAAIPLIIIDSDETILLVNREVESMTGFERADLEHHKKLTDCVVPEEREQLSIHCHDMMRDGVKKSDFRDIHLLKKNGTIKQARITLKRVPGFDLGLVSVVDAAGFTKIEKRTREELEKKCYSLKRANEEIQVLLKYSEKEKFEVEGNILANVKELIMPCIAGLKQRCPAETRLLSDLNILEKRLANILSPFSRRLTFAFYNLSPRETEVASLLREGRSTKEIMEILNLSKSTVDQHRHGIRKKLDLVKAKTNLRSFLITLQ